MAFNDSWTGRNGILGWMVGDMLPTADGSLANDIDAQLYLGQPAQHDIDHNEPGGGGGSKERRGIKIGLAVGF